MNHLDEIPVARAAEIGESARCTLMYSSGLECLSAEGSGTGV